MDDSSGVDICRVCRSEGLPERPLFHPCICTGSIKWIHQECLVQWMRYSRKEYCELCSHRFSFTPIYSPDMPRRLPLRDVVGGLLSSIVSALKYWLHYALVAFAWLGLVPLTACRVYRCLFSGSIESILTLPFDILKTRSILPDVFHGCFVVTCTLFAFLGMLWLREQIVHGGGPDWLDGEQEAPEAQQQQQMDQPPENDNAALQEEMDDIARLPANISSNNYTIDNSAAAFEASNNLDNADVDYGTMENPVLDFDHSTVDDLAHSGNEGDIFTHIAVGAVEEANSSNHNGPIAEKAHGNYSNKDVNAGASGSQYNEDNYFDKAFNNYLGGNGTGDNVNKQREQIDLKDNDFENGNVISNRNDYGNELNYDGEEVDFGIHAEQFVEENVVAGNQDQNQGIEAANDHLADENQNDGVEAEVDVPVGAENAQDDGNWNPIEWDRAVEELTWERLLGLDGSLVFLEHVVWVVMLNAAFIICFACLPYHFGNLAISSLGLREKTVETNFEGLITTLCGYCILGICLVILHTLASLFGLQKSKRIFGLCYVVVKVSLLSVMEIGALPLICGWWLDICSLSMFDASLKDRETSFRLAPGTSMFVHWLVGMVYVYYFASFILLLREVVRPGVLWFLINFNDPDFNPIQEMIHTPIIHHIRRLLVSSIIFGTAVLLMFWFPVLIIRYLWPTFLPYAVSLQIETQFNELSLELLLFQVILPALLEQSHTRIWMKGLLRLWCKCAAWIFGIHSYLLGDKSDENEIGEQAENNENNLPFNGLGAAHHQALLPRDELLGFQPYQRPSWFYARLLGLLLAVCISLVFASLVALTLPVWIGRKIMSIWLVTIPNTSTTVGPITAAGDEVTARVHELYTAACGTYLCWLIARAITILRSWLPQGRAAILDTERLKQWCLWGIKSLIACTFLLGIIPLLFGLLLELVVVVPIRVPLHQTPVLFVWQDWALGVLYTKIACAVIIMGPDWKMRRAIERVYRDGIRNMDLSFILCDLAIPVTAGFSLALAVPYATAHTIVPLIISNFEVKHLIVRILYPCLLIVFILSSFIAFQIRQFKKLYEHIKNDKYLVGKRLVNYDHRTS